MDLGNPKTTDHFQDPTDADRATVEAEVDSDEELPDPRPVRSKSHQRFLTLATMMKNQRRWLREWLEFNLMNGFNISLSTIMNQKICLSKFFNHISIKD